MKKKYSEEPYRPGWPVLVKGFSTTFRARKTRKEQFSRHIREIMSKTESVWSKKKKEKRSRQACNPDRLIEKLQKKEDNIGYSNFLLRITGIVFLLWIISTRNHHVCQFVRISKFSGVRSRSVLVSWSRKTRRRWTRRVFDAPRFLITCVLKSRVFVW